MQNPIDNATYTDLKKPLNKFSQLLIIYQRLSETDSFIKHGSIQNRLKYDKIGKIRFLKWTAPTVDMCCCFVFSRSVYLDTCCYFASTESDYEASYFCLVFFHLSMRVVGLWMNVQYFNNFSFDLFIVDGNINFEFLLFNFRHFSPLKAACYYNKKCEKSDKLYSYCNIEPLYVHIIWKKNHYSV